MTRSRTAIWIDDNPAREGTASSLGARFINVKNMDLAREVELLLKGPEPRLVIIDHVLDKTATPDRLFKRGSTIAEAIKGQWPACPVIGVTNADLNKVDGRAQGTYDALFPYHNFSNYFDRINSIQEGFASLARLRVRTIDKLVHFLVPPNDEIPRLTDSMPDKLKRSLEDGSVPSRSHRWVEHLMERPGFLYDQLWTATILGLTETGFLKVVEQFKDAKYKGIFARGDAPRWWSSRLIEILRTICNARAGEFSWQAGRRLHGLAQQHYSSCYSCKNPFPEVVGFLDEASDERHPMHLKCTVLHPRYKRELYFEDIRMMEGR